MSTTDNNAKEEVAKVSVRTPEFWRRDPKIWFCQMEAQFEANQIINDKLKYNIIVAAIDSSILSQVSDILINPPQKDRYETLKNRLLQQFSESDQKKFKKLLTELELGDRCPSHLLREMRSLAGESVGADMLRSLWLQRLPVQVQAILSTCNDDVNKLAEMADKILELNSTVEINSLGASSNNNLNSQIEKLTKSVAELQTRLSRRDINYRSRTPSRSSRFNSRSRSRSKSGKKDLCWYHANFGKKATKCRDPCKFEKNSEN